MPVKATRQPSGANSRLSDIAAERIRRAIVSGALSTGERITEERLASELGMSRIPVREALQRLQAEGFVYISPNVGAAVAQFSTIEIENLLAVRAAIESLIASQAAQRRDDDDVSYLRELIADGYAAIAQDDDNRLDVLDDLFHERLKQASKNETAGAIMAQLRDKTEWMLAAPCGCELSSGSRRLQTWRKHKRLLDLVKAQDAASAAEFVRQHFSRRYSRLSERA
jgi:DNA-binding GntR family transcriptional regulator